MITPHDSDWLIDHDYCGRILRGSYSLELKQRVAECINQFRRLDHKHNPAIPYISAWHEDDPQIWYEYVGSRLSKLLDCQPEETAKVFAASVIKRSVYVPDAEQSIKQKSIRAGKLPEKRLVLRQESQENGFVEAVYKIGLKDGVILWLKDQAETESFRNDKIYLSLGGLTCISKEMKAAEERIEDGEKIKAERDRLEMLLEKQAKEIWKSQLEIIYRLARATEFRDKQTGSHLTKMSHYCHILAEAAGMDNEERTLLFHAAPMHDVGKIGISESILQKKGPLTEAEFELMKDHAVIGAKLLSGNSSKLLSMARSVALTHHEKWDGSGYPRALDHEAIPLTGRIAAICDVFDALTSERPYKEAWTNDEAISELKKNKGTHFEPHLVDLFVEKIPEIREVQQRFAA
jgi:putative two-component system response regulator